MPLVFTAAIPNAPALASELAPDFSGTHSKTYTALQELIGELYFMKPDTLIFLTAAGSQIPELMNTNISSTLRNKTLNHCFNSDVEFAAHLKETIDLGERKEPMTIIAETDVAPEVSVPLAYVLAHLEKTKVVMVSTAQLSLKEHYAFGEFLRHAALDTNKRVAVLASGSLGVTEHTADTHAQTFDTLCCDFIRHKEQEKILQINPEIIQTAKADIVQPLSVLLGVIHKLNVRPEVLSYELLHGAGQLVANFVLL
ncbi:MAG: hypothetical protein HYV32_04270 [Candidatus Kerfeldbacteria bacterium]|nr:hypothetical protein [Candidatus Kerfeldbacteria bacterium]